MGSSNDFKASSASSASETLNQGSFNNSLLRRRVLNERKQILKNPPLNWRINYSDQKWNQWQVQITAQNNCPFHSTPFKLIVRFGDEYPYKPPQLILPQFNRFFHPNISSKTGFICEKTLKNDQAIITARQRIDAFIILLAVPNPDDPLNVEAANQYKSNRRKYNRKALQRFNGFE